VPDTALDKAAADITLTRSARDVLEQAVADSDRRGEPEANPVDVLRAVLSSRGSLAYETIRGLGIDPAAIIATLPQQSISPNLDALARNGAAPAPPLSLRQLLVNANREAQVLGHYQVDSIHLLLVLMYSDSPATSATLQRAGITLYDLRQQIQSAPRPVVSQGAPQTTTRRAAPPDRQLRRKPLPSLRGVLGVSPTFIGLLSALVASGAVLWFDLVPTAGPLFVIVFVVAGWVVSLSVHEFGHAFVAYLGGDSSVVASGYLNLNPLRYTNVLLSIVMPVAFLLLGGIALPGGAVYIDRAALRSRWWDTGVSLAGPLGTLICTVLVSIPFVLPGHETWITQTNVMFFEALAFLGFVQVFALLLNLVPIPGLDGFGAIRPWLSYSVQASANRIGFFGILIVFALLWYVPPIRDTFFMTIFQITDHLGIPAGLIISGSAHMRLQ
jgi:Zn-dependent protease